MKDKIYPDKQPCLLNHIRFLESYLCKISLQWVQSCHKNSIWFR